MSGRDEKVLKDFPICPKCKNKNSFWRAVFTIKSVGGICFNRDDYLVRFDRNFPKLNATSSLRNEEALDDVIAVCCVACKYRDSGDVLRDVIEMSKRILRKDFDT